MALNFSPQEGGTSGGRCTRPGTRGEEERQRRTARTRRPRPRRQSETIVAKVKVPTPVSLLFSLSLYLSRPLPPEQFSPRPLPRWWTARKRTGRTGRRPDRPRPPPPPQDLQFQYPSSSSRGTHWNPPSSLKGDRDSEERTWGVNGFSPRFLVHVGWAATLQVSKEVVAPGRVLQGHPPPPRLRVRLVLQPARKPVPLWEPGLWWPFLRGPTGSGLGPYSVTGGLGGRLRPRDRRSSRSDL